MEAYLNFERNVRESLLNVDDVQFIYEQMCISWSIDPRDGSSIEKDALPSWNPTWFDFIDEIPEYMLESFYKLVFPTEVITPPLEEMRYIPLISEHIKIVKGIIDILREP